MRTSDLTRRTVLGALGVGAATALAGCGDDSGEATSAPSSSDSSSPSPSESESAAGGGKGKKGDGGDGGSGGTPLVATADVPVGSGVILKDQELVVTQPTKGTFLAFSAICTHQGCPVGTITGDQILCPCHGSVFSAEDGSVIQGPAGGPLASVEVSVEGDQVVQA